MEPAWRRRLKLLLLLLLPLLLLLLLPPPLSAGGTRPGPPSDLDHRSPEEEEWAVRRRPLESRPPGGAPRFPLRTVPGPARRPAFLFQPQRFGREVRTGQGPRAGHRAGPHFWSLAVPQRFGKK